MGNTAAIPNTVSQITAHGGKPTELSSKALAELNQFIGNSNGKLGKGVDFSKSSKQIYGQIEGDSIKIKCQCRNIQVILENLIVLQFYNIMKKVGEYEFIRLIGQGSYGSVYEAKKEPSPQRYAIKMIPNEHLNSKQMEVIEKQIQILKKIEHPNIVKLLDTRRTKNNYYLVFEYCEKGDLENYIRKYYQSTMPEDIIQKLLYQITDAVRLLHSKSIVHRDIKLANILLTKNFTTKLADFGFAKSSENTNMLMQTYCGTPITMAPEILLRKQYDFKCDIWSLGVITYQLVFGKPPFLPTTGGGLIDLMELIQNSTTVSYPENVKVSEQFKRLIQGALCKDPTNRYSVDEFCENSWIQAGRPKSFKQIPVNQLLRSVCKDINEEHSQSFNTEEQEKAIARRLYGNIEEELIKIKREIDNFQIFLQKSEIDLSMKKLKQFLVYTFVKSINESPIKIVYKKQEMTVKVTEFENLKNILSQYEECAEFVSFKNTIFAYLEKLTIKQKSTKKQDSIKAYKIALQYLNYAKRFNLRFQIVSSSNYECISSLEKLCSNLLGERFGEECTNHITVHIYYSDRNQQFIKQLSCLKSACERRIRDLEEQLHGY